MLEVIVYVLAVGSSLSLMLWMEAVRGVDYLKKKKIVNNRLAVSQNSGESSLREKLGKKSDFSSPPPYG